MAYIEIIQLPGDKKSAAASNYFFRDGVPDRACKIEIGEAAYVPDDELDMHVDTGAVKAIKAAAAEGRLVNPEDAPRPGRKPVEETPPA